jgi:hypothetical protein
MDLKYYLPKKTSIIYETVSLRNLNPFSEELIQSKLNTYKEVDNMSKKEIKRNSKPNKIINWLGDIKFDTIITESGLVVSLLEKKDTQEAPKISYWTMASALALLSLVGALLSPILAFVGYKRGERGAGLLLKINAYAWGIFTFLTLISLLFVNNCVPGPARSLAVIVT